MSAAKGLRILVTDDNEINLKVIRGMLEHAGHQVDSVLGGKQALKALTENEYDLLVLDCLMPEMDGFEVTREIRMNSQLEWNSNIPILAVTALAGEEDRQRCLSAGMDGYICKPVMAKELYAWIAEQFHASDLTDVEKPGVQATTGGSGFSASDKASSSHDQSALARKMSVELIQSAIEWQPLLHELLATKHLADLGMLAHKIRGTADVFGFQFVSEIAVVLEESGKQGNHAEASTQVPELINALQRLVDELQGLP